MEQEQKEQPKYTTIIHKIRLDLELSCNEYCVADIIYHLSNNPTAKVSGWCYASKDHIADFMGLHRTAVYKIINKLIDIGLVIKDDETKWLKTTEKWYNAVVFERIKYSSKKLHTVEKSYYEPSQKATTDSSKKLHNNNIDIHKLDNTTVAKPPDEVNQLIEFFRDTINPHLNYANKTERKACSELISNYGLEKTKECLLFLEERKKSDKFLPIVTTPYELWNKWAKIKEHLTRQATPGRTRKWL